MQPPPNVRYSPFNEVKPPRGRFEWDILNEAFEVVKSYWLIFCGFCLICYFATATLGQITAIPQTMMQIGGSTTDNSGMFIGVMVVSMIVNMMLQSVGIGVTMGGLSKMTRRFAETRTVELNDGFSAVNKTLPLGLGQLAPYVVMAPLLIIGVIAMGPQLLQLSNPRSFSDGQIFTLMSSMFGAYAIFGLTWFLIMPLFMFTAPAIILEDLSFTEALKKSFAVGKSCYGSMLLLQLMNGIAIVIATVLCCFPALFVFAWYGVTLTLVYSNVANVPLSGAYYQSDYSPYPREAAPYMPSAPAESARPVGMPDPTAPPMPTEEPRPVEPTDPPQPQEPPPTNG